MIRHALGLAAVLGLGVVAEAQYGDVKLDPKTYASPSGEVTLFVDPSQPSGGGGARYRCSRAGKELWSGERPYTLWEAEVADDGLVAGYAYAAGYEGGREDGDDALTIVLLAPDGKARLEERSKREGFMSDMGTPDLLVGGLFLDPENDRLAVRARTGAWGSQESWWTYSLSAGTPGPRLDPCAGRGKDDPARQILAARPVPGTRLVLMHQQRMDFDAEQYGATFTLLDREGKSVWRLDWPEDYTVRGDDDAQGRIREEVWEHGVVLGVEHARFTLRQVATSERVTFEVEHVTGARKGWEVREVAREAFTRAKEPGKEASAAATTAEPQKLALTHLGTIPLGAAPPGQVVRNVMTFALDGRGRPGFLRRTDKRFDFVRVDSDGKNAVEIPVPEPPKGAWFVYDLAWTRGERWVVIGSTSDGTQKHAWWLDASTRKVTEIEGFAGPSVEALAGTPDGGFIVLGTTKYGSYFTNDLVAFGSDGQRAFALGGDQGDPKDPASLFAPEAITVLASGEIVVLGNIRNTLQFFSPTGEFLRFIELEEVWGREPNYPAGVRADREGGLLVYDFEGEPPVVCTDASGKILGGFAPHYADGRPFSPRGDVQSAGNGELWSSDGDALLVLDRQGLVQRVLGAAPEATVLGKIGVLTLGPDDRIYAADDRTGAVHVFRPNGVLQHVCAAAPDDFEDGLTLTPLTVTDAGEVQLGDVHFAADGARLRRGGPSIDPVSQECYAQRGSDRIWMVGYEALHLLDPTGKLVRKIERTPDDKWLRGLDRAGVAPDGSIALAASNHLGTGTPGIHLYSPSGDPVRTLEAPEGMAGWATFAYDGERLAIGVQRKDAPGAVVLMDAQGRTLGLFEPERAVSFWLPFFAAGGKELWLFDGERSLERYALP